MSRILTSTILLFILTACGGGGGGGGDNSPSRSNVGSSPNNNQHQNLQTGVFTDAPVAGLRYRQGASQGVTDANGQFTYDVNDQAKIEFLIGGASIGFAKGAQVITPFDLQARNGALNYHRGINVSRLLVSMDVDNNPSNGIELTSELDSFSGNYPFDVKPSDFGADEQLKRMLPLFGVSQLVGEADVIAHLSDNPVIIKKMNDARDQLDVLGDVLVRWNSNLSEVGVLSDIEAANGERMIVLVDGASALYVSAAIYFDAVGRYTIINYSPSGVLHSVNVNGTTSKVLGINNFQKLDDLVFARDLPNFNPPVNYVAVNANSSIASISHSHNAAKKTPEFVLRRVLEGLADGEDVLQLSSVLMKDVEDARCRAQENCSSGFLLAYSLQQALNDQVYLDSRFSLLSVGRDVLDISGICLSEVPDSDGPVCESGTSLANFMRVSMNNSLAILNEWNAIHVVPWASGLRPATFKFTSSKYRLLPDATVYFSVSELPPPWIEAQAAMEYEVKVLRINNYFSHAEYNMRRITSPLAFRECFYQALDAADYWESECTAFSNAVNTPEKQAVVDALADMLKVTRDFSALLVKSIDDGSYTAFPLHIFRDGTLDPKWVNPSEYFNIPREESDRVLVLADKYLAGLSRYYDYLQHDDPVEQFNSTFLFDIGIDFPNKWVGFAFNGKLHDARFNSGVGFPRVHLTYRP